MATQNGTEELEKGKKDDASNGSRPKARIKFSPYGENEMRLIRSVVADEVSKKIDSKFEQAVDRMEALAVDVVTNLEAHEERINETLTAVVQRIEGQAAVTVDGKVLTESTTPLSAELAYREAIDPLAKTAKLHELVAAIRKSNPDIATLNQMAATMPTLIAKASPFAAMGAGALFGFKGASAGYLSVLASSSGGSSLALMSGVGLGLTTGLAVGGGIAAIACVAAVPVGQVICEILKMVKVGMEVIRLTCGVSLDFISGALDRLLNGVLGNFKSSTVSNLKVSDAV
jgi:hypothetical protein